MTVAVNLKITDAQAAKIKASGLNRSEFIRRAIDYYDTAYRNEILKEIITYCEGELESKDDVKNNKDDVKNNKVGVKNNKVLISKNEENKDILYTNKDILYTNTDNLYTNKENSDVTTEKPRELPPNVVAKLLANDFRMIQRILNNPENGNSLPDFTLNKLKKEHNISKKSIENFIHQYKEPLKKGEFD